ncbi:CapA family protein [Paenibacillus pasadenensis]|uniref:Putative enzyme of poly-gamma-glutamate biosynthesis (Capsule formation) n=1 Tax=Paenibacillus pasadenensis TaxID=217090 RepID=A0A2N5N4Q1_9BACL|nr:CapA family protein [Paenibacillus pasadenensis]PLT45325.1 putative enzyme of poly-gamma-glutamate biosynthesis (capsule formation) [Paenibacillus pasadenensis]
MYRNRSQARQQQRQRRKRAVRRLLVLNVILLALLLGAGAVLVFGLSRDNRPDSGGAPLAEATAAPSEPAPATAPPSASPTASPSASPTPSATPSPEPSASPSAAPSAAPSASPSEPSTPPSGSGAGARPTASPSGWSGLVPKDAPTIRLAFTGDILLAAKVAGLMESEGLDYPFTGAAERLSKPDLTAGNLETPITSRGNPATGKQFVFKGKPAYVKPLKDAGFDVVTLANNHTLDQGVEGLLDTIGHLDDAGLPHVGGGRTDKEAYAPVVLESGGVKVAYLGVSRVLPVVEWKAGPTRAGVAEAYDPARAEEAIRAARKQADLVVVMVHWGRERADQPVDHQRSLARAFIDAGADLIIGAHPHVLQGFELYKGKWIAYSLGNFIFTSNANSNTSETGVLDAVCAKDGRCGLQFHPMKIAQSRPAPVSGEQLAAQLKRLNGISKAATIGADGTVKPR